MVVAEVLVVVHDSGVRHAVRRALDADPRFLVVAETGDDDRALTLAAAMRPDAVVVDGCDDDTALDYRQVCPGVVVVAYGSGPGADATVDRSAPVRELVAAVLAAVERGHQPRVIDLRAQPGVPDPRRSGRSLLRYY